MNIPSLLLFTSLTFSVACSVTPTEGEWLFTGDYSVETNTCGEEVSSPTEVNAGEEFFRIALTDDGFTLNGDYPCTMSGSNFDCDMGDQFASETDDYSDIGYDAVSTFSQTFSGSFRSSSAGDFVWGIASTCSGADCQAVQDEFQFVTCEVSFKYGIEHADAAKD